MKSNLLHINIEKSCYIHFVPRYFRNKNKNKNNFDNNESTDDLNFIKICGMPLKEEIETKFLGVTIDNELICKAILIMFTKNLNLQQEC